MRNKDDLILRLAGVLACVAAGLILWSFVEPPRAVHIARVVGQMLGTLAFLALTYVTASVERHAAPSSRRQPGSRGGAAPEQPGGEPGRRW